MAAWPRELELRARDERPEELPYRYIKAEGRLLQHHVGRRQLILALHPVQAIHDAAMRIERALGPARGTGREDHVRQVVGRRQRQRRRCIRHGACLDEVIEPEHHRSWRQRARDTSLRKHHGRGRVLEHERETIGGIVGIERHIRAPRLHHGHQRNHQINGPFRTHAHEHVASNTECTEPMRQRRGAHVELRKRERLMLVRYRHRVRRTRHLRAHEAHERIIGGIRNGSLIPRFDHEHALLIREWREVADERVGVCGHSLEERGQMVEQSPCGAIIHHVALVLQLEADLLPAVDQRREWKVRPPEEMKPARSHRAAVQLERGFQRQVLEDHLAAEDRRVGAHLAPALDVLQWRVLHLEQRAPRFAQLREPRRDGEFGAHAHAHGNGIDEQPHHVISAVDGALATRARRTEHHVVFARVVREQQCPRPLHHGVERELVRPRHPFERSRRLGRQHAMLQPTSLSRRIRLEES